MSDALRIVTPEDAALAKKPPARVAEVEEWKDADSTKLVDLLEEIDGLKYEIHERMRRIEAVKQARSVLLEDAVRTEALNRKLHELGRAMGGVQAGYGQERVSLAGAEPMHVLQREVSRESELRGGTGRGIVEESVASWHPLDAATVNELVMAPQAAQGTMRSAVSAVSDASKLAAAYAEELLHEEAQAVMAAEAAPEEMALTMGAMEAEALTGSSTGLASMEPWRPEEGMAAGSTREEVNLEPMTVAYQLSQEAFEAASLAARELLEEAERVWKQASEATEESKRLLDEATLQLKDAIGKEEKYSADFEYAQQALSAGYRTAGQRLEEAERLLREAEQAAQETHKLLDQSMFELVQSRVKEETATTELLSARQELTTAYQFAAVAAQRRLDAEELFLKTARWAVIATALSWVAMIWACWFSLRQWVPIWGPGVGTAIVVLVAGLSAKRPAAGS